MALSSCCNVVVGSSNINNSLPSFPFKFPSLWPINQKVKMGPLSVSPMGFGTWAWGNQLLWGYKQSMDDELQQIFNMAVENGVNFFDTADSYGTGKFNGQSEKLLGKFIRDFREEKGSSSEIVIATKFAAYPWRLTPGQFVNACRASLDRMQIEQIGIGQLHCMGEDQLEIKSICDSLGIRVIAYSPLGLGMLTGKYSPTKLPTGPRGLLFKQILPGLEPLLSSLRDIANKRRKTVSQVAINWCICKGTIPIPGVKSITQAEENLGALGWRLSSDELLQLEYAAQQSPRRMIQNIFQTR
ncbi:putative aldo-keto reductase [Trifolium repens]|nr:putative aldo-keto reductase [Trifolium repens]